MEKNSAPEGCTLSETRETGTDGARGEAAAGGSLLLTVWVSDSEPFLSSILTSAKAFYPTFTDPRSLKAREGRQVNEGKSIVKRF